MSFDDYGKFIWRRMFRERSELEKLRQLRFLIGLLSNLCEIGPKDCRKIKNGFPAELLASNQLLSSSVERYLYAWRILCSAKGTGFEYEMASRYLPNSKMASVTACCDKSTVVRERHAPNITTFMFVV